MEDWGREVSHGSARSNGTSTGMVLLGPPGVPQWIDEVLPMQASLQKSMDKLCEVLPMQASLQKSMDKLCQSQASQEQILKEFMDQQLQLLLHDRQAKPQEVQEEPSLAGFIQEQIQDMKSFLAKEVQACKDELLAIYREELRVHNGQSGMPAYADHDGQSGTGADKSVPAEASACNYEDKAAAAAAVIQSDTWETSWQDFQKGVTDVDRLNKMHQAIKARIFEVSVWHKIEDHLGKSFFPRKAPNNCWSRSIDHPIFQVLQNLLIISNTLFMGYEVDISIKGLLDHTGETPPLWLDTCNEAFNVIFLVELLLRMAILRSWFWVAPYEWGWNVFDLFVVAVSWVGDVLLTDVNLSFIRMFRILRAVRVVRMLRLVRFFRELRKILLAIFASLASLTWCFIFLAMTMYMFSILFLQGMVNALTDMEAGSEERQRAMELTRTWFRSIHASMFYLLSAVTGGVDWLEVREPLVYAGPLYTTSFLAYVLFVTVGVMNVLTGVFLTSAEDLKDKHIIVQDQQVKRDQFVLHMLSIFQDMDSDQSGEVDWPTFCVAMRDDVVQSYLAAHDLEPTHAKILFDLLDERACGKINIVDWVMGMVKLKGAAKAIDARIIQRELGMLPKMLHYSLSAHHRKLQSPQD